MSYLYKYRNLNQRIIQFIEAPTLYFAEPTSFNDVFEVGAELNISASKDEIVGHFEEYLVVLKEERDFEKKLAIRQHTRYLEDLTFEKEQYYLRRRGRLITFDDRISYAESLISGLKDKSNEVARDVLHEFYESIRKQLKMSAICCLCRSGISNPMWVRYADESRGIAVELNDRDNLFKKKIIERYPVNYSESGTIDPIVCGYRETYNFFHTTKTTEWMHEQEERFFIYGKPRPVKIPSNTVNAIVLGERTVSGDGLSGDSLDNHIELLKILISTSLKKGITLKQTLKGASMKFKIENISGHQILEQL